MANVRDSFDVAVAQYYDAGWYANWPLSEPLSTGELCRAHGRRFSYERAPTSVTPLDARQIPAKSWQYQSSKDLQVELAASGFAQPRVGATLRATFQKANGLYLSASEVVTERVADVEQTRKALLSLGETGQAEKGAAVVVERLTAGRVLLMASAGSGGSLEASSSIDGAAVSVPADLAGSLQLTKSDSTVTLEQYAAPVTLAARLVVLGTRGWFWWKRPAVRGVSTVSEASTLATIEATSDYFLEFTGD